MPKFLIGFEISGHVLVEAPSQLIAATKARALARSASNFMEATGESEYRCPSGTIINMKTKARHAY